MLASEMDPDALISLAQSVLNERQFRAWFLRFTTCKTVFGVTQQLRTEGFTTVRRRPISLRSVQGDLRAANRLIDEELVKREDEEEGERAFDVVTCRGGQTHLARDYTAEKAHEHLGCGLIVRKAA